MDVAKLLEQAVVDCNNSKDLSSLDLVRVRYLGKKGELTTLLKSLGSLDASQRPIVGQEINQAKNKLQILIEEVKADLAKKAMEETLKKEVIDVSLPGRGQSIGSLHPVTLCMQRITDYFIGLGFDVIHGPEIETTHYNFEALNIPSTHPARALHDTFYFDADLLLRTHTSPVQIRTMEEHKPPLRLIMPGRVYRCDSDVTHTPMFHQVEGLFVDVGVNFSNLKAVLIDFFKYFFEKDLKIRMRPHYFPFTEPSAEVDITCVKCNGDGCRICKNTGWLEVLGCGMVHPNVLKGVDIDSEVYSGWAFGLGVDRLAMLRYGIDDLRVLFDGDIRFLEQFNWN